MQQRTKGFWFLIGFIFALVVVLILVTLGSFLFQNRLPTLAEVKGFGESIKPNVEVLAIIVAGWWSYRLFIKNRKDYPYAETKHTITHWPLGEGKIYLSVIATVTNAGNVLLPLTSGQIHVQQVRPLFQDHRTLIKDANEDDLRDGKVAGLFESKHMEVSWCEQGYREPTWPNGEITIEPGESEELQYDFLLDATVQTVKVISYFKNEKRKDREAGWTKTTMYDLQKSDE